MQENCTKNLIYVTRLTQRLSPYTPCKFTIDLETGVQVTCDLDYLYANFSLPGPLCSRLRSGVRDRQTDVRRESKLNACYHMGREHNNEYYDYCYCYFCCYYYYYYYYKNDVCFSITSSVL